MARKQKKPDTFSTYCRSYLVTVGLIFAATSIAAWRYQASEAGTWPWWGPALLAVLATGGGALILFGLLGPSNKMDKWAEVFSRHEASLIFMPLAYPVYLIISPFYGRR
ncbi:hypothetical protein [Rhodopirellula baltica]|uniref:hypothetical protein n=1 Tax=Rhodopirellula baltica TaxID=265606 RepID=UPI000568695F|nr:hypothetical protein [Rhodopirellula baltica]